MNTPIYPPVQLLGRPFSPSSLTGLKLWMDASQTLYSNVAGSTAATTDGTAILNVPDRSGVGNTMTRATGTGPVLRIESGSRVISFESAGWLNCAISSGTVSAFSLHLTYKPVVPCVINPIFTFGAAGASPLIAPTWVSAEFEAYQVVTGTNACASEYASDPNYRILSLTFDGSLLHTYLDGAEIGPSTSLSQAVAGQTAAAFTRAGYAVGKETSFNHSGNYRMSELCYYEAYQTYAQMKSVQDYLRSKWSAIMNTTDRQVVYVMNSLGSTLQASENSSVPYLCYTGSTKIKRWVTACRPSIKTTEMTSRVSADYAYYVTGPTPRIAVVWEGTNDIAGGSSGATAYANLVTLAQALKAAGYTKIVMGTMLPRGSGVESARTTLNTSIRANTTDWDVVADVGGDATIGAAGANSNTTYYGGDAVHLNNTGNGVAAPYFRAAIDGLLP